MHWLKAAMPDLAGAACAGADPEQWFPLPGRPVPRAVAEVCAGCPVRQECADYAVSAGPMLRGVWGGLSQSERARIRQGAA